ncbi:unnamed protein product, partial [Prorocentrum cordatum]
AERAFWRATDGIGAAGHSCRRYFTGDSRLAVAAPAGAELPDLLAGEECSCDVASYSCWVPFVDLQPYWNLDIVTVAWETVLRGVPIEIVDKSPCNFGAFPQRRRGERLLDETDCVANSGECRRGPVVHPPDGAGGGDLGVEPVPGPIVDAGAAGKVRGTLTPRERDREVRAPAAPEGRWVIVVADGSLGVTVGDDVAMPSDALISPDGRMGLEPVPCSTERVLVERLRTDETPSDYVGGKGPSASSSDACVVGAQCNSQGVRQRVWREVSVKVQQVEFKDWPMPRPRTVLGCVQFVDRRGDGPMDHRRGWMGNLKLSNTYFGVQEHRHGMQAFQFFGEYGQIDFPNQVGLEVIMGRCQVTEFHYEKANKGSKANKQAQGVTRDGVAYFSGSHRLGGEVMNCPGLVEWVSKEIGRDVGVTGQMKKAREHRSDWESDVARALNELGGYQDTSASEPVGVGTDKASPAQFRPLVHDLGLTRVRECVAWWGKPPADLTCRGAFRELQASHSYQGSPVSVAPLNLDLLRFPAAGVPQDLGGLVENGRDEVQKFVEDYLLPKDQLRWASCLICFCSRDLCAPIYTRVLATDASEWGLGVTETVGLEADVKHAMSFSEAWRFKEGGEGAREQARERIEEAKVTGEKAENANVPEGVDVCARLERGVDLVPRSLVGGPWRTVRSQALDRPESIPVLGTRAAQWGLRHVLRNSQTWHKRVLILSDSMSAVLALSKGRTSAPGMLRVVRRWAALALVSGCSVYLRWISSEENPADAHSRRGLLPPAAVARRGAGSTAACPDLGQGPRGGSAAAALAAPEGTTRWRGSGRWRRRGAGRSRRPDVPLLARVPAGARLLQLARPSYLQAASVRPRTQQLYLKSWESFEDWARFRLLPLQSEKQVDDAFGDFFDYQWFEGAHSSLGSRLVVCLVCDWLVRSDRWSMAVAVLMYVVFYLRPSEVNKWDDSRPLDLPDHDFMAPLLEALRRQTSGQDAPVFEFTCQQWGSECRKGGLALGLQDGGPPTLCGLRHAGASLVISLGRLSPLGVQHRGGWAQPNSRRRYQKAGRLMEQLHFLPHGARLATAKYASEIGAIMS